MSTLAEPGPWPIVNSPSEHPIRADVAQRLTPPEARFAPSRRGLALALVGAAVIHAGVLAIVFFEASRPVDPTPEAIPIEIVMEPPPPPPPPPPQEKPQPPPPAPKPDPSSEKALDEEPANDAPRAVNQEKSDREAPDTKSRGPKAPDPTQQPSGGAAPGQAAGPTQEGEAKAPENAAAPIEDKPDAEAITKAAPEQGPPEQREAHADSQADPQQLPSLVGQPFPVWSKPEPPPELENLGELELGRSTPIAGGKAKSTYLSVLYGMVVPRIHMPAAVHATSAKAAGVINFAVDGAGRVTRRKVIHSSGSPELDAAALAAIAEAEPFPAPPGGEPMGLVFTYGPQ